MKECEIDDNLFCKIRMKSSRKQKLYLFIDVTVAEEILFDTVH